MFKSFTVQLWFVVVLAGLCVLAENADAANAGASNGLRSAYLGSSVWSENLSSKEINNQLKDHFAEVLVPVSYTHLTLPTIYSV